MIVACAAGRVDSPLLATAANTGFHDAVIEAGRRSIIEGGRAVRLDELG
jgi:hypothetical protein